MRFGNYIYTIMAKLSCKLIYHHSYIHVMSCWHLCSPAPSCIGAFDKAFNFKFEHWKGTRGSWKQCCFCKHMTRQSIQQCIAPGNSPQVSTITATPLFTLKLYKLITWQISARDQAFSIWNRTGKLPSARGPHTHKDSLAHFYWYILFYIHCFILLRTSLLSLLKMFHVLHTLLKYEVMSRLEPTFFKFAETEA